MLQDDFGILVTQGTEVYDNTILRSLWRPLRAGGPLLSGLWCYPLWHWPPAKWVYLLIAAPPSYVLGAIFWGSSSVWYPFYTEQPRLWGLSPLQDQRYAGMLMWLHGWMYLMASMLVFFLWYDPEKEERL